MKNSNILNLKTENNFTYLDEGKGKTLILLHGLFGALSNWESVISGFKKDYRVIIPILPIYTMPYKQAGLKKLTEFLKDFIEFKSLKDVTLIGNSLGGHLALMYTLKYPKQVQQLVLTGSSGLFENSMGTSYPKRGNRKFIKEKIQITFYNPKIATETLVEEVFQTTQNIAKTLSIIAFAKSAQRNNLSNEISKIKIPTLLIWGLNDTITPPNVAHTFNRLIKNSTLKFIDKCCHVPMMEHAKLFNQMVKYFLLDGEQQKKLTNQLSNPITN